MPKTTPWRELIKDRSPQERARVERLVKVLEAQTLVYQIRQALDLIR